MASHISILVTGSRSASGTDAAYSLDYELRGILEDHSYDSLSLFVGCARGADELARAWWKQRNGRWSLTAPEPMLELFTSIPDQSYNEWNGTSGADDGFRERMFLFHADWAGQGKAAGMIRNSRMVKAWAEDGGALYALALWDGASRGTLDTFTKIVKAGHDVRVLAV